MKPREAGECEIQRCYRWVQSFSYCILSCMCVCLCKCAFISGEQNWGCLELTDRQCAVHWCRSANWIKSLLLHCSGSTSPHFGPLGWHFLLEHLLDINFSFQLNYSSIASFRGPSPQLPVTLPALVFTLGHALWIVLESLQVNLSAPCPLARVQMACWGISCGRWAGNSLISGQQRSWTKT